jgi:hypothetical protein
MTRSAPRLLPAALLLANAVLVIGFVSVGTVRERPYFAFAQGVQLVPPGPDGDTLDVLALHDLDAETLCVWIPTSASGGKVKLCGPAKPGSEGALVAEKPWTAGKAVYGPLTSAQVTALRKGLLYLQFTSGSPTLFPGRRGQLFPIKGVKYVSSAP